MKSITVLFLFLSPLVFGQSTALSSTIAKIEFKQDTIQAVYDYVTDNIRYDVNRLRNIKQNASSNQSSRFDSEEEYKTHLLSQVIKNKKGVCEDYSLLFHAIVQELGYTSFIVEGYTKNSKGNINRKIGHVWNAVKVDGTWKLYDPTWGAGYVENDSKFVKQYSEDWYDVNPKTMLLTHMPFDPIWQLSAEPISYASFDNNVAAESKGQAYDFEMLLEEFFFKDGKTQMQDQDLRSASLGDGIRLVDKWRSRIRKKIGLYGVVSRKAALEDANNSANNAVELFNKYVAAKNKKFKGARWSTAKSKEYLIESKKDIQSALDVYQTIKVEDVRAQNALTLANKNAVKLLKKIDKELIFLDNL